MSGPSLLSFDSVQSRLYPMLLPVSRVDALGEGQMVARLLVEGVGVAYVEDTGPNTVRFVTWGDLQQWGISKDGLHQVAIWNLETKSEILFPVVMDPPDRHDPMFIWTVGDGYDASRILLHDWIAEVTDQVSGELLLGVPERHWLVATGSRDPEKRTAFRRLVQDRYYRSAFGISPELFVWRGEQLEVYRD